MCDLGALDEKVELITILNLKTLAYFRSKSEFYIKILSILIEISSFSKMVSIIWKLKFGKQGIILNLHDTFEHGRVLGRSNLKNKYTAIQNVCYLESEEEVFKKLTKNIIRRKGFSQKKMMSLTQINFASIFSAT